MVPDLSLTDGSAGEIQHQLHREINQGYKRQGQGDADNIESIPMILVELMDGGTEMNAKGQAQPVEEPVDGISNAADRPVPLDDTCAVRDAIAERYGMTEILDEAGGPAIRLILKYPPHPESGYMRIWESPAGCVIDRLFHIYVGGHGNDVNLMYAMTRADSRRRRKQGFPRQSCFQLKAARGCGNGCADSGASQHGLRCSELG